MKLPSRTRSMLAAGAIAVGAAVGAAGIAGAVSDATSSDSAAATSQADSSATSAAPDAANRPDPATVDHGPGEELLTGDTASKVEAAATEAEPDATIIRVETDSEGAAYEAHMTRADGTQITLTFDENFELVDTIEGFGGPGPMGQGGPGGMGAPGTQPGSAATDTGASSNA